MVISLIVYISDDRIILVYHHDFFERFPSDWMDLRLEGTTLGIPMGKHHPLDGEKLILLFFVMFMENHQPTQPVKDHIFLWTIKDWPWNTEGGIVGLVCRSPGMTWKMIEHGYLRPKNGSIIWYEIGCNLYTCYTHVYLFIHQRCSFMSQHSLNVLVEI